MQKTKIRFFVLLSVEGRVPQQRFDYTTSISDPKYKYSQSWRLDALHSMKNLKKGISPV